MAELSALIARLETLLSPNDFEDAALNGIQVESPRKNVTRIGVAVDAGESIIEKALHAGCQLLIVHHGLMWGKERAVSGPFGRKVALLLNGGCSLYGSHLPLDAHLEVGNNALLAKHYDLIVDGGFASIGPKQIGVRAHCGVPRPLEFFVERSRALTGAGAPLALRFGSDTISAVGIVSGSGASAIEDAAAVGLDLLISGEPKQHAYHDAKELGMNCIFAGHYATETLGVRALGDLLAREFGVEAVFIDEPTGI